jgi:hypothetical protein
MLSSEDVSVSFALVRVAGVTRYRPYGPGSESLGGGCAFVHQHRQESDDRRVTHAVRWPMGETIELSLDVAERTGDFPPASLVTEARARPDRSPWLVNDLPERTLDRAVEREHQAVRTARAHDIGLGDAARTGTLATATTAGPRPSYTHNAPQRRRARPKSVRGRLRAVNLG